METARIAQIIDEMGTLLEIKGENPFRCRAYHTAAQALSNLPADLPEMIADGSLKEVPGIGETMYAKIVQLATTGQLAVVRRAAAQHAAGPGRTCCAFRAWAPRRSRCCTTTLKIESLADLRAAGESGQIAKLKGFGAKTEAKILEGIAFVEKVGERILQSSAAAGRADPRGGPRPSSRSSAPRSAAACGGGPRRSAIWTFCSAPTMPAPVLDAFVKLPQVATVLAHGPTKASVRLADGVQCDLRGVEDAQFPFALHYFTGSKAHNIAMRKRALARGFAQRVCPRRATRAESPCKTEAEVFEALGLAEIPPELREDSGEIEAAESGRLPDLIEPGDLTGTFHCHTDWSDGAATLAEMAEAARAAGCTIWESPIIRARPPMPVGLSIERVREQWAEIDALNKTFGGKFHAVQGDRVRHPGRRLARLSRRPARRLRLRGGEHPFEFPAVSRDEMTQRLVRAASNPRVTMLGHPTGRLLLARDGYDVDLDAVIDAAARPAR